MAKIHHRVFALIGALLFLVSSAALTIAVVWSIHQQNQVTKSSQNQSNQGGNKLAGTKLQNFTPISSVDKLQVVDLKVGNGDEAKTSSTVTAHYTGALAKDGTIFESSKDSGQPATFPLNQVIQGWQLGVPGMKVGGTRRLIIPAALAYGEAGSPPKIGPNEPLVFDIELISVQ